MATAAPEFDFECKEDGVPATIPWIQPPDPEVPHRPYSEHESTDKGNRQHDALTRAFPFYLPARYHRMDAREMQKMSKSPGSYWTNTCHFVRILNDYGTIPYYNLHLDKPYEGPIKSSSEFCETAHEFLLEPWVLIQLPFQPALLHQWAVAALAETLRFCKRLVEIGSRGYAPKFHDLYTMLAELSQTLTKNCHVFFWTFFNDYCKEPAENIHVKAKKFPFDILAETLAALGFVLSVQCLDMLDCIKRVSWSKKYSPADLQVSSDFSEFKFLIGNNLQDMPSEHPVKIYLMCPHMPPKPKIGEPRRPLDSDDLVLLEKVAREIFSTTGPLKGMVNTEEFIEKLAQHMSEDDLEYLEHGLEMYKKVHQDFIKLGELDAIRNQLFVLEGDVLAEYAMGIMTAAIWRAAKRFDSNVYLDASDIAAPPEYSVEIYKDMVRGKVDQKKQWTTERILGSAQTACALASAGNQQACDVAGILCIYGTYSYSELLANIIRSEVLKMYNRQYATLQQGPFHFYPECLFLQYIVPCFVAMLIDVQNEQGISNHTKNDVLNFVSDLVYSYVESDHAQILDTCIRKRPFYSCFFDYGPEEKVRDFIKKIQSLFGESNKLQEIVQKFAHICDRPMNVVPKGHPNPELFMPTDSDVQISILCCKLEKILWELASIRTEQRFKEHRLMTLRGLISISKFIKNFKSDMDQILEIRNGLAACDKKKLKDRTFKFMLKDSKSLSAPQLNSIIFYEAVSSVKDADAMMSVYQGPLFPEDSVNLLTGWILSKDWWSIKRHCAPTADLDVAPSLSMSFIPLQLAKRNLCCRQLLKALTPSKKVPMDHPGQVTFFPIQHCRWCGLVYCTEFRLCAECKDEPDYPHLNFFCSAKCEKEALDACHLEEHARYVMQKLGL